MLKPGNQYTEGRYSNVGHYGRIARMGTQGTTAQLTHY